MSDYNATVAMRDGETLDAALVQKFMLEHIEGLSGLPEITQFPAGQSNLTYCLTYPSGRRFVLRRPPFGTKPKSGHSMIREYRVMKALKPVFPAVPPVCFYQPEDNSPIGAEFYVMDHVDGLKPGRNLPGGVVLDSAEARRLGFAFFDKLIQLHAVDFKAIGLADFGRSQGYVERQILGWNSRWERAKTPDVDDFSDVCDWLASQMPVREVGHSVVHGDYRLDNVILNPENIVDIRAVLDWEISALGDPLMDLGNTLAYWLEDADPGALKALRMQPSNIAGMPTRAEIVAYYGEKTGLDVNRFDYYLVYGTFRLAVILQQIYYRFYHGQTKNPAFQGFAAQVNVLGRHARRLIEQA